MPPPPVGRLTSRLLRDFIDGLDKRLWATSLVDALERVKQFRPLRHSQLHLPAFNHGVRTEMQRVLPDSPNNAVRHPTFLQNAVREDTQTLTKLFVLLVCRVFGNYLFDGFINYFVRDSNECRRSLTFRDVGVRRHSLLSRTK